jgi:sugar phosphate isomerase/epimerase
MGGLLTVGAVAGMAGIKADADPVSRKGAPVIKIGCAAQSYQKYLKDKSMTMDQYVDAAAEMGAEGVELTSYYWPEGFDLAYLNKLKRKCFLLGLDVCATSVGNNFVTPAGPERDKQINHVKQWIEYASEMGAPCMRVFGGSVPKGVAREDAIKWVIECFQTVIPVAEQHGVVLGVENHGGMPATAEEVIRILDGVKSDWVGSNLDLGNFRTEDPYADIAKTAPYAVTTHFKTEVAPGGKEKVPTDLKRIVGILRNAGYRGYLTLEFEGKGEPKDVVPKTIQAMREAVKE